MKILNTKLVQFQSTDGFLLPGLLFEPEKTTKKVAINLHGNGSSSVFYSFDKAESFSQSLNQKGISYFAFNNRGAHYIKNLTQIQNGLETGIDMGTAYELIKDCIYDIDGAIEFLEHLGYTEFYLMGGSTGANKICVYNYYKPNNKIAKYILLGAADDTGIYYNLINNREKFFAYLQQAQAKIQAGQGRELVPADITPDLLSWQSFYDTCNPDGDYNTFPFHEYLNNLKLADKTLFREYQSIEKPMLVMYGELDEYCSGADNAVKVLKKYTSNLATTEFKIIAGANHGFDGYEAERSKIIIKWLISN